MVRLLPLLLLAAPATAQLGPPPVPAENPITEAKVRLGKTLFWDDQLSVSESVSCGSCHISSAGGSDPRVGTMAHPALDGVFGTDDDVFGSPSQPFYGTDGMPVPDYAFDLAVQVTTRRALPPMMAAYEPEVLWDGLAPSEFRDPVTDAVIIPSGGSLESQVLMPLRTPTEMGHVDFDWQALTDKLADVTPLALASDIPPALNTWLGSRDYPALFTEAFGDPAITPVRIAFAIATYERSLVPDQTPMDDYLGGNTNALTPLEEQGWQVFQSVGCVDCHPAPTFASSDYYYIGLRPKSEDRGRFYTTALEADRGKFRSPSLRNVELRAPFFHNGRTDTLMDVVEFFDRGGDFDDPSKDPRIIPLGLTQTQKDALVAFMGRPLTDPRVRDELRPFERPRVYHEGPHVAKDLGGAVAGSGGFEPRLVAPTPPRVGEDTFRVSVDHALGGATALLSMRSPGPPTGAMTPLAPQVLRTLDLQGAGDGEGWGYLNLSIPDDPSLIGRTMRLQWLVRDPLAPGGVARSNVVKVKWF